MSQAWSASPDQRDTEKNIDYLAEMMELARENKEWQFAALDLKPGQSALDVGCGIGDDVATIAELVGPTGRAVGLDHNSEFLVQARERTADVDGKVEFVEGDIYAMPFPDDVFDVVRSDRVFQHLHQPQDAVNEIVRVTKPGGRIALHDQDVEGRVVDFPDAELLRKINHMAKDYVLANGWAGRRFYGQMRRAGLTDIDVRVFPWIFTNLTLLDRIVPISDSGRRAYERGLISEEEARQWAEGLERLDKADSFFAAGMSFLAVGTKPDA